MQTKLVPFARSHVVELVSVLSVCADQFTGKSKKKTEGKAEKKQACMDLMNALVQSLSEEIRLQPGLEVRKDLASETRQHRDELLRRVTEMSVQEFKKLFKLKM